MQTDTSLTHVIDVTAYGADPSGQKESTTAVAAALKAAATFPAEEAKTLYFPKGEYHFYEDYAPVREYFPSNTIGVNPEFLPYKDKHIGILIENMENLTLDGSGSLFLYHGNISAFVVTQSKHITLTDFSFDYSDPTVHDLFVESRVPDENAVVVYIPEAYHYAISADKKHILWHSESGPVSGKPYLIGEDNNFTLTKTNMTNTYIQTYDTTTGWITRGGSLWSGIEHIEDLGNRRVKFTYSGTLPKVGASYQTRNHLRPNICGFIWESEDVTMAHLNVHYVHSFGILGQLSKDITLDSVNFQARPETKRTTVGAADFFHMSSIAGKVTVKNCSFSSAHDDAINIHGTFLTVEEVSDDSKTFLVKYRHDQTAGFPQYYVGDQVDFSTRGTMIPVENSQRTVTAVENRVNNDGTLIRITLDRPVEGIIGGGNHFVVENVTYTPEIEISHCRFMNIPTRGILTTTRRKLVIEHNYFDHIAMHGIFISCDAQEWYESGRTEQVIIRDNFFGQLGGAAICYEPTGANDPEHCLHKNLLVESNVFDLSDPNSMKPEAQAALLDLKSVENVRFRNNIIKHCAPDTDTEKLYYFDNCKDVILENNICD